MKQVIVRFEHDEAQPGIDVAIRASCKDEQVEALMQRVRDPLGGRLNVQDNTGLDYLLPEEQIVTISADNKRLRVDTENGTYWLKASLKDIEQVLNHCIFLRISRYEIINLRKVTRFDFTVAGTLRIELDNGTQTWGSRRFIPAVRQVLEHQNRGA